MKSGRIKHCVLFLFYVFQEESGNPDYMHMRGVHFSSISVFFLFLWWLESDDVSDVLQWAGFLAFLYVALIGRA